MVIDDECTENLRCWECTKNCTMKKMFELPDPLFMSSLNETSKIVFEMLLNYYKIPYEDAERERNLMIITLATTRKKYLEEKQKTS